MTRKKALKINSLLLRIEAYEALISEITCLETLPELYSSGDKELEKDLTAVVQSRLNIALQELEEM